MKSLKKNWLVVSNMTYEIWEIFTPTLKSLKISLRWALFVQSIKVWDKKYRGVIFRDTEQWYKIWINLDLVVSKLASGIPWTFIKTLKNLKILNLMGSFCPKHDASASKFQRNYVSWHWKLMQNLSENWLVAGKMTRNLVNFRASSWKSENLYLMGSFCRKHIKF